jgi:amino acid transporter
MSDLKRVLGLWDVVFFNVAAILGLRWLSTAAQMGPSSLVLWFLAMLVFFVPLGLVVTELSTRLPGEGGIYLWAKEAFGPFHGFIAGWTYWVNNLFYYPALLLFIAGAFLYLGGDSWLSLEGDAVYNAAFSLGLLWIVIGLNVIGLDRGKWVQNCGGAAKWLVFVLVLVFGTWSVVQFGSSVEFTAATMMPRLDFSTITFLATMTFAFAGFELAPVMSGEIKDPRRTLPRAMVISGISISVIYMAGTAFVLAALPEGQVNVITGIPQAFAAIGDQLALPFLATAGALLILFASSGGLGAWIAGAARMPFVIGIDAYLPKALGDIHPKYGSPHKALIVTGVLTTVLMLAAVAGSTIEEAYILLVDMAIILYFIPFLYLFVALPVLQKKGVGDGGDLLTVPGGKGVTWILCLLGFVATLFSIILAMTPPEGTDDPVLFLVKIIGGTILFLGAGLVFYMRGK